MNAHCKVKEKGNGNKHAYCLSVSVSLSISSSLHISSTVSLSLCPSLTFTPGRSQWMTFTSAVFRVGSWCPHFLGRQPWRALWETGNSSQPSVLVSLNFAPKIPPTSWSRCCEHHQFLGELGFMDFLSSVPWLWTLWWGPSKLCEWHKKASWWWGSFLGSYFSRTLACGPKLNTSLTAWVCLAMGSSLPNFPQDIPGVLSY